MEALPPSLTLTLSRRKKGWCARHHTLLSTVKLRLHPVLYLYKGPGICRPPGHILSSTEQDYRGCFLMSGGRELGRFLETQGGTHGGQGGQRESQDIAAPMVLAIKSVTGPHRPHPPCLNPPGLGLDCEGVAPMLLLQANQDVIEVLIELQGEE